MALHALLLFGPDGLQGGADLQPHLRLIQQMGEAPALRNVYAPAYHVLGALLSPVLGLASYPRWFGLLGAAALLAGFRVFQRAARLPDACAALFAWAPYLFALSWCIPKIEAAGYGLAFAGLALVIRGRPVALAAVLAATFAVHTAAALFLGLAGGVLALALGDRRALAGLAAGSLVAAPLFAAHLAAGCRLAEAFLFSQNDYLRSGARHLTATEGLRIAALAGPIAVVAAASGARALWRGWRPVAILAAVVALLYANEIWLAPFDLRTTLDLMRGLTLLAFPVAIAGGVALAESRRLAIGVTCACALWALVTSFAVVPGSCHVRSIDVGSIDALRVDRCTFRWSVPRRH